MIEFDGHLYAFIAALSRALFMVFKQKQRVDRNPRLKWSDFWSKKWDDLAAALLIPQFLTFVYEALFSVWANFKGDDQWDFYFDTYEGVCVIFGLFGILIYTQLLKRGEQEIKKH